MASYAVLETLVVRMVGDTSNYTRSLDRAVGLTFRATEIIENQLSRVSSTLLGLGTAFTLSMTTPILGGAAASLKNFAAFDDVMTTAAAVMGDVSDGARDVMDATAFAISEKSITKPTELAHAYFVLASAGYDAASAVKSVGIAEKFAVAGAFDMARGAQGSAGSLFALREATSMLIDSQAALGMRTGDNAEDMRNMQRISDVLVKANAIANAEVKDFARSLTNKAASAMRLVNMELEEGVAILAAYASQGVKAESAGEKLYIVLRDMQRAVLKNGEEWTRLGLSVFDGAGNMLPVVDILTQLENKLAGMSDEQKRATFMALGFQDRSLAATLQLMGMSDAIRDYEKALRSASGVTEEIAEKRLSSFNSQMRILINQLTVLSIKAGERLAPVLLKLNEYIRKAINWWEGLRESVRKWIGIIGGAMAAIGPFLVILGTIGSVIGVAIPGLILFASTFMVVAKWVIIIGGAIAGLIYLIGGTQGLKGAFESIKETATAAFLATIGFLENFEHNMGVLAEWIPKAWSAMWSDAYTITSTFFSNLWNNIKVISSFLISIFKPFTNLAINVSVALWKFLVGVSKAVYQLGEALVLYWSIVGKNFLNVLGILAPVIGGLFGSVLGFFFNIFSTIISVINAFATDFLDATQKLMVAFVHTWNQMWTATIEGLTAALGFVSTVWNSFLYVMYIGFEMLHKAARGAWNIMKSIFLTGMSTLLIILGPFIERMWVLFSTLVAQVVAIWNTLVKELAPVFSKLGEAGGTLGEAFQTLMKDMSAAGVQFKKDIGSMTTDFDKLKGTFEGMGDLKLPELGLPEFKLDLPDEKLLLPELDPTGGFHGVRGLEEMREEFEEPIIVEFKVVGLDAIEAGTSEALLLLQEHRQRIGAGIVVPKPGEGGGVPGAPDMAVDEKVIAAIDGLGKDAGRSDAVEELLGSIDESIADSLEVARTRAGINIEPASLGAFE